MAQYNHILLAADFNDESEIVVQRARMLQEGHQCKLSIIHVIEPVSIAYGGEFPVDLSDLHRELEGQANCRLKELGNQLNTPEEQRHLKIGITDKEILRLAKDEAVDLIVAGSHGKHGFALLLGSTANAILHYAKCDVLAVRVGPPDDD